MKKLLFIVALMILSLGTYAQKGVKSILVKAGYQTDYERFGIGFEGRYNITDNFRLAPDLTFLFPHYSVTGLDINLNIHYVIPVQKGFSLYPLAGLSVVNNRYSWAGYSNAWTDAGFNIGAGGSYDVSRNGYLNFDFKYTFSEIDCAAFMFGYGVKF